MIWYRNNMLCKYSFIQATILFSVASSKSYLGCPAISQRQFREKAFCSIPSHPSYVCLFDENQKILVEFCERSPDYLAPGLKFVVRGGFDGAACPFSRFQPFKFWTNSGNDCVLLKSKCEEDGQITKDFGSTTTDVLCRCDYSQGYAFVNLPLKHSACDPSFEDCSCYKKVCSENHILSQDYNCTPKNSLQDRIICSTNIQAISYAVHIPSSNNITTRQTVTDIEKQDIPGNAKYQAITILMIFIIVIAGTAFVAAVLTIRESKSKNEDKESSLEPQCRVQDKGFSDSITAIEDLVHKVIRNNIVIVVGQHKSGKSTIVNYVALLLHNIYGYDTIHCKTADDIDEHIKNGHENKILLLDNYFVCDSTNDDNVVKWKTICMKIKNILTKGTVKMIITCLPSHLNNCYENKIEFSTEAIFQITTLLGKGDCKQDILMANGIKSRSIL